MIRKVIRYYKDAKNEGRPKVAVDRKSGYRIEQVQAKKPKRCAAHPKRGRMIWAGEFYAYVTGPDDFRWMPVSGRGNQMIPDPQAYHFACVPEGAKYLVRFFRAQQ